MLANVSTAIEGLGQEKLHSVLTTPVRVSQQQQVHPHAPMQIVNSINTNWRMIFVPLVSFEQDDQDAWYFAISFVARLVAYVSTIGMLHAYP